MKNVLVIAAHPDDEILGQGATMRKLANEGVTCRALILGEGLTSRTTVEQEELNKLKDNARKSAKIIGYESIDFATLPDNMFDSVPLLEIIKTVLEYVKKYNPDTIFTHHYGDLNIDHRKTFEAVITAVRPFNGCKVNEIYAFEIPSSTEWNYRYGDQTFKPNYFVDVTDTLEYKLKAMDCYETEGGVFPHPRSLENLKVIARRWGGCVDREYVEAFELIRKVE